MLRALTTLALLLTPPGTPSGGFHWQRIITPPPAAPTAQACVVLDAATFANAAPALGDLRLFQDGNELPYVIEESYDDRALTTGITPDDDRSEYEPVLEIPLRGAQLGFVEGRRDPVVPSLLYFPTYLQTGTAVLARRVPVERIRIEPVTYAPESLVLSATPEGAPAAVTETVTGRVDATRGTVAATLGANLQNAAQLTLRVVNSTKETGRAILEMRRRSLCYQPRSASPLVLYFGGGQGIAAKVYGPSRDFTSALERPYATLGPLEPNPDQQHRSRHPLSRVLLGAAILAATLLLTLWVGLELLRKEKSRPQAAQSQQ